MRRIAKQLNIMVRGSALVLLVFGLTACVADYRNHGHVPSEEELAEIKVGVDTRDSVSESVGVPSSSGVLDQSGYYYVATRMKHYGLKAPQIVERQLVAISFDTRGVVNGVERFSLQDGRVIPLERRVTSSSTSGKTFLRQLIGNLGNFSPGDFGG